MRRAVLSIGLMLVGTMCYGQEPKASEKFELSYSGYKVVNKTPFAHLRFDSDLEKYEVSDVDVSVEKAKSTLLRHDCQWSADGKLDTILLGTKKYDPTYRKWRTDSKIPGKPTYREYYAESYAHAEREAARIRQELTDRITRVIAKRDAERERKRIADEEYRREREIRDSIKRAEDAYYAELNRKNEAKWEQEKWQNRTDRLTLQFYQPTSEVQTKAFTNDKGVNITYSYYMKDGEEVLHGKYTARHIYKDYKFWAGGSYGFIYLNGIETFECTYKNGVMHGQYRYSRDVKQDSTFGNEHNLKHTIALNMWNGFLDGSFDFVADEFRYVGRANHGILEQITVTKLSNSHSQDFKSNMNGDRAKPLILTFNGEFSQAFYGTEVAYFGLTVPKQAIPMPYVLQ